MTTKPTPAPDLTSLADADVIDLLMGAGLLMLAAQSNGDESGRQDEERRMHDLRAELLRRLTRASEPETGYVIVPICGMCNGSGELFLGKIDEYGGEEWGTCEVCEGVGVAAEAIRAALAQAGEEDETE